MTEEPLKCNICGRFMDDIKGHTLFDGSDTKSIHVCMNPKHKPNYCWDRDDWHEMKVIKSD